MVYPNITSSGGVMYIDHDLYFYNIKRADRGTYKCRAVTKRGEIQSGAIELKVNRVSTLKIYYKYADIRYRFDDN